MIDTDKYEGLIDAEGYIDYDGILILLSEVKRLRKRSKKLENALLTLADGAGDVPMFNKGGEAYEALWGDEE